MLPPRLLRVLLFSLLALTSVSARAQLSGSLGLSAEATNNVQSLDTTSPDQLVLPAFTLTYSLPVSGSSKIDFSGSMGPSFYAVNPAFSYNASSIGATGEFYLSNTEAIALENLNNRLSNSNWDDLLPTRNSFFRALDYAQPILPRKNIVDRNDSLVDLASSALYTLSGELDSSDVSPTGLTKRRVRELEDLRDSISDAVMTIADLLDSAGYSESTAEVVIKELSSLRSPLATVADHLKPSRTNPRLLDEAIAALKEAKPESDYLPTAPTPMGSAPGVSDNTRIANPSLGKNNILASAAPASAPVLTLVNATTSMREFGYNDISVREDIDDSGAMTLATKLTVPISWSSHKALSFSKSDVALFGGDTSLKGNPNDNTGFAFGAAVSMLPSTSYGIRASYDYTHSQYPFDTVYSSTENRLMLMNRLAVSSSTVLLGELSIGFRNYLKPFTTFDTVKGPKGRQRVDTMIAASKFNQLSYGAGISQFFGERMVIGALAAFNSNPNLRAYVTNATVITGPLGKKKVRAAVQIADDEYTYDLKRYTIFGMSRVFWDADLGADISFEDRTYGSEVAPNGNVIPGGQGRTETGIFTNVSLSKLIAFEDRLLSVFNAAIVEARLSLASVNSSDKTYTYNSSVFTLGGTLTF